MRKVNVLAVCDMTFRTKAAQQVATKFVFRYKRSMETFIIWLVASIEKLGYPGIVVLMAMESTFFPIPSELVIPPAGYLITRGQMNAGLIIASGTLGSLLGASINYALAVFLGRPLLIRYGKYVLLSPERFNKVDAFFNRHGEISTFSGRFIPVVRHIISFPAGLARMDLWRFCFYTTLGSGIWVSVLTYIGYLVGNNITLVQQYSRQVTLLVMLSLAVLIAGYVWWQRKSSASQSE